WDALSMVGGIGASYAMEMLRNIGSRMNTSPNGEPNFISSQPGQGNDKVMSQAQAKARIDELKTDKAFYKRLVTDKVVAARREWVDRHKLVFGRAAGGEPCHQATCFTSTRPDRCAARAARRSRAASRPSQSC